MLRERSGLLDTVQNSGYPCTGAFLPPGAPGNAEAWLLPHLAFRCTNEPMMSASEEYKNLDDGLLVVACRNGDAAAWETLVNRFQRLVYAVPRNAGLDDDQCADIFQRSFTLLVEHLDRLEHPERVRAWLVTTARRETMRALQRADRLRPLPGQADDEVESPAVLIDSSPLPEDTIVKLEEQHLVRSAVGKLDERCHRLLTLLFYQPESPAYDIVAREMGVPVGSIGPTRARCLQKLANMLKETGLFMYFLGLSTLCLGSFGT